MAILLEYVIMNLFTVIVTTHDRPLLLRRTLKSLIAQTYQNFSIIIVSDSSSYIPPYEELSELNGRYTYVIRSGTPGPAESRNMGCLLAKSDYVIFLDDDDTFEPAHLESLAAFIGNSRPEIMFSNFQIWREDRTKNPPQVESAEAFSLEKITEDSVFVRNTIPNNCLIYRKDVIENIKHDASMRIYEDWDFLLECLKSHHLTHVPIFSVIIHKTISDESPENLRRGNSRHDLVLNATLELYKKHKAPNETTRLARQSFFASAGFNFDLEYF